MRLRTISLSALLHVAVVLLFSVSAGWFWTKQDIDVPPSVSVEIIQIAEKTQTDKKAIKNPKKTTPKKAPPKEVEKKPAKAATNKNSAVKPPPIKNSEKKLDKAKVEPTSKKTAKPPKAPSKKPPRKPPKKQVKTQQDFSSVLKNLADNQEKTEKHQTPKEIVKKQDKVKDFLSSIDLDKAKKGQDLPLGTALTISEIDLLRRQLSGCWSMPIGARDAENLVIDIFMVVNPDRTVQNAKIKDQSRYNRDSFFRAAADSALRAVYNSECSPLELPVEKYNLWKEIIVTFDPKNMF